LEGERGERTNQLSQAIGKAYADAAVKKEIMQWEVRGRTGENQLEKARAKSEKQNWIGGLLLFRQRGGRSVERGPV